MGDGFGPKIQHEQFDTCGEMERRQEGHGTNEAPLPHCPHLLPQRQYFLWRKAIHFFRRVRHSH